MTQANPFMNFDMTKMMADFDPAKFTEQFAKLAGDYKLPTVDVNALMDVQRKNVEALTAANKAAAEGAKLLANRQAELLKKSLEEANGAVESLTKTKTPQEAAVAQTELMKKAFETTLVNMREIADMVTKSNTEAAEAVNARVLAGLEEVKKLAVKAKK